MARLSSRTLLPLRKHTQNDPGAVPVVQAEVVQVAQPIFYAGGEQNMQAPEGTLAYTDGDEDTTDVYCNAEELLTTTHLNLFNNDIARIENLGKFPNLLRLTVRSNEIEELSGLSECPTLRWVDVSDNNLKQIGTVSNMHALEWMDVHNNELKTLEGFGQCSRLTFLNVRHSDLHDIRGIEALTALRWLDVSSNEIVHIKGLEKCLFLTEVNLNNNDLADVHSVARASPLPCATRPLTQQLPQDRHQEHPGILCAREPKCRVEFDNRKSGAHLELGGRCCEPDGWYHLGGCGTGAAQWRQQQQQQRYLLHTELR